MYCAHHSTQLQNSRFPIPMNNITSQDIITWYKRENGLLREFPPITSETFKNALLLAESSKDEGSSPPADCGRPTEEVLEKTLQTLSKDVSCAHFTVVRVFIITSYRFFLSYLESSLEHLIGPYTMKI